MKLFQWITKDTNINFLGAEKLTYAISIVAFVLSIAVIGFKGFNYGIDFAGGILMEIKSEEKINLDELRSKLDSVDVGEINLQTIGENGDEVMIRAEADNLDERAQMAAINKIKQILGNAIDYRKIELVGPQVGDELKIAGAVALVAGSGGAALPVAACITLSACNDIYNGMMDATYTYTGDYNKVGNTNALKDFLVKKGGETGEILFGDEKLGEKMGSWAYTGLDVVSFLNGVDKLGKSFGKLQTITSGTAETSKVWGEIHMDDVIDNDLKYLSKDGIIKTILHIDPNSVANFGYDVVTGTIKSIKSAGKLGNTIADLAVG